MTSNDKLYYVFCSPEEEVELMQRGIEFLDSEDCEICPTLMVVDVGDTESVVNALYAVSTHGGYLLVTADEYRHIEADEGDRAGVNL